jgi:hypothetical protein
MAFTATAESHHAHSDFVIRSEHLVDGIHHGKGRTRSCAAFQESSSIHSLIHKGYFFVLVKC